MLLIFLISELHSKLFHIPNECFFYLDNPEMASKTRWVLEQFGDHDVLFVWFWNSKGKQCRFGRLKMKWKKRNHNGYPVNLPLPQNYAVSLKIFGHPL